MDSISGSLCTEWCCHFAGGELPSWGWGIYGRCSALGDQLVKRELVCVRACVRVWVCGCVRACMRACVRVCVRACMHACVWVCLHVERCIGEAQWNTHSIRTSLLGHSCKRSHNLRHFPITKVSKQCKTIVRIWQEEGGCEVVGRLVAGNGDVATGSLLIHLAHWGVHQNVVHYKIFTTRWRPWNNDKVSLDIQGNCCRRLGVCRSMIHILLYAVTIGLSGW